MIADRKRLTTELPILHKLAFPILRGPLTGMWWSPAKDGDLKPLLGQQYTEQLKVMQSVVNPGDGVVDIGAGKGFFSMLFAKLVTPDGNVAAIESDLLRARFANFHAGVNQMSHVTVRPMSIGGTQEVESRQVDATVDSLVLQLDWQPTHLRIAIRNDDLSTLRGAERIITDCRPTLFLSTHGERSHHQCCKWLVERGYELRPLEGSNVSETRHLICTPPSRTYHFAA